MAADLSSIQSLLKELHGQPDSRGLKGILSRGKNVYKGTSSRAHAGGGKQFGRPSKKAIKRRLEKK